MIVAPKWWMTYTFHLSKHGSSIYSSSTSRKSNEECWTLNSIQKWYGERETGFLLSSRNIGSVSSHFPYLCLALTYFQRLEVSFKPDMDHLQNWFEYFTKHEGLCFMVSNKIISILFACYFIYPQKYIHAKITEILVCSASRKINSLAAWWSYFSKKKQGKLSH